MQKSQKIGFVGKKLHYILPSYLSYINFLDIQYTLLYIGTYLWKFFATNHLKIPLISITYRNSELKFCLISALKPYVCQHENCHKRFANKFLLKKHEFIHTGKMLTLWFRDCFIDIFFFSLFSKFAIFLQEKDPISASTALKSNFFTCILRFN